MSVVPKAALYTFISILCLSQAQGQGILTTIAGTDWLFPADGLPAVEAPLNGSYGLDITTDQNGNFYIADNGNQMAMRVGTDGIIRVIAGNGILFSSGDGGLAVNAAFADPQSIAVDSAGNVYIGEYSGEIRKVTTDGIVTKIAGTGTTGFSGDGGPALLAQLYAPYGIAVDAAGDVYVADTYNQRVRRITPDGIINTIAGGGTSLQDGVKATSYHLETPTRIRLDGAGNLYINNVVTSTVSQSRILKVSPAGIITTVAGGGSSLSDGIPASTAAILPTGFGLDSAGNFYLSDFYTYTIRKVDTTGIITTIAGTGKAGFSGDGGPALQAEFSFGPDGGVAIDSSGNILVADDANGRIRKIDASQQINTVAGNGLFHFSGDGGAAITATLDTPTGLAGDQAGNLYVTEPFLSRIRRIAPDGTISVFAGTGVDGYTGDGGPASSAQIGAPAYLATAADGSLVFSDELNCVIRSIDTQGVIHTIAGSPSDCTILKEPQGIDFDSGGNLAIADSANNRVRGLLTNGTIFTLAGTGVAGYSGDGGPGTKAQLNAPVGVRVHGGGVYFCDSQNNVIRYIDFSSGIITTVAGTGQNGFAGDGGPAIQAQLSIPNGLGFDAEGNMYIADTGNSHIRKVDSSGTITSVAGSFATDSIGDGQPPLDAFIGGPVDIFFPASGNLVFTDVYSNRVREILNSPPGFQATPASLAFTAAAGAPAQSLSVSVTGAIPGISFAVTTSAPGWLTSSLPAGQMPANVSVSADPASLAPGSYTGTITISAPTANPPAIAVPVSFTVTSPGQPNLSANPASMTFAYTLQDVARSQPLTVSNTGGGQIAYSAVSSTTTGANWLSASPGNTTLGAFGSSTVSITADPTGLSPGTYSGVVTISSVNPQQSVVVPVTMTITAVTHTILVPETGLSFFAVEGGGAPPPQRIDILNTGQGQMPWSVSTSTLAGGTWLAVFPENGQTDASSQIVPQVRVNVNQQGLSAGTYYGSVNVSSTGATNDPQFVSVILTVLPAGSTLGPIVEPAGMIFAGVAGAESPGSQSLTIQSTSSTAVTFTAQASTATGGNWIQGLPLIGTITQNQPQTVVVQPVTQGLAAGTYRGSLTFSFSDGTTRSVALLLVVVPPGSSLSSQRKERGFPRATTAGCTPTTLAPVFTQLSSGSNVPAGYPGFIVVEVVDDCANPLITGGVVVTFSNGDPPLELDSVKDGSWVGTWTPQHAAAEVDVTAVATNPAQNLRGEVLIKVGTQEAAPVPLINANGVVNAASFAAQSPVAPGSLVAVFGSKLATGQAPATGFPLPIALAGSSVVIGGVEAPLLFASDGQVNTIIPFGIPVNTTQQALAERELSLSVPQQVIIAPAAPGVFTSDGKQGIVVDVAPSGVQTIVDTAHPATQGDALVIYCTGLGEVTPPVPTGAPAPSDPISQTVNTVTVTIGGAGATVLFSGLTPTLAGLYQVNVVIPTGITTGPQVPLVVTAAGQSSVPVTIAVQ